MKPLAYLVEEFDYNHVLVWSGLMTSPPTELSWSNEVKSKLHNVVITPLIADTAIIFFNICNLNNISSICYKWSNSNIVHLGL